VGHSTPLQNAHTHRISPYALRRDLGHAKKGPDEQDSLSRFYESPGSHLAPTKRPYAADIDQFCSAPIWQRPTPVMRKATQNHRSVGTTAITRHGECDAPEAAYWYHYNNPMVPGRPANVLTGLPGARRSSATSNLGNFRRA